MRIPGDADRVELSLLETMATLTGREVKGVLLNAATATEVFEAQVASRLVDHTARWLRANEGRGYYTIGSAGHESNAVVAMALRPTDPALLHYRSGGFYLARAAQVGADEAAEDILRGMLAYTSEPISGGRHKVFGHHRLNIIPQTSTIGSHLPRAVGLAASLGWGPPPNSPWPQDSVVICSFGDASLNHSTVQGAVNWASNLAERGEKVPILFLCEDNGLGISVPTPKRWVAASTLGRPGLEWGSADGARPGDVLSVASELVDTIRDSGMPGFLHLRTVRYLGHAGTDVESAYRSPAEVRDDLTRDPLAATAAHVVANGVCRGSDLVEWYLSYRQELRDTALALARSSTEHELETAEEVMAPLTFPTPAETTATETGPVSETGLTTETGVTAETSTDQRPPENLTLAQTINRALADLLENRPETLVFGEDVGHKGGVYGLTRGLQDRFGSHRVFDTILDESSILGLALGASLNGYLPIPEIQYLAYLHNAEDQLRGEAATLRFFSNGQYTNPMVIRIAAYAYQRGFGGHFHNDNSVAVLRDIPGLIIASPSHPADAAAMLNTCVGVAKDTGAVCAFLEPIALYHSTDLHRPGDGLWTAPPTDRPVPLGQGRVHGDGRDGTMVTWGNGLRLALQAVRRLADHHDESWRVLDLRWLAPLPVEQIMAEATATGRVLVVDETRHTGGVGEGVIASLIEGGFRGPINRVAARDSLVPLGAAANLVLVDEEQIVTAALKLEPS